MTLRCNNCNRTLNAPDDDIIDAVECICGYFQVIR